jgi:RNA polymerase sigma factor (sigma-70 family)
MTKNITPEDLQALKEFNDYIREITDRAAAKAAREAVKRLGRLGRITYVNATSYQKTEQLLYLYRALPEDHEERKRIDAALDHLAGDEYRDVIIERYMERRTLEDIAELYGAKYQTIARQRTRLVRLLACDLFPEDVAREIRGTKPDDIIEG